MKMSQKRYVLSAVLGVLLMCGPAIIMAQEKGARSGPMPQVMLGIRVLKVSLVKKYSEGLDWKEMPFNPGLNNRIDFYKVLRKLKSVGEVEVLFNQSLIGISGGKIEADSTMTIPVDCPDEKTVEVGGSFKGTLEVEGDEARIALDYRVSYLYGKPRCRIAQTEFKADVAIGNGQTLVIDDLIIEEGAAAKPAEIIVFISALIVR